MKGKKRQNSERSCGHQWSVVFEGMDSLWNGRTYLKFMSWILTIETGRLRVSTYQTKITAAFFLCFYIVARRTGEFHNMLIYVDDHSEKYPTWQVCLVTSECFLKFWCWQLQYQATNQSTEPSYCIFFCYMVSDNDSDYNIYNYEVGFLMFDSWSNKGISRFEQRFLFLLIWKLRLHVGNVTQRGHHSMLPQSTGRAQVLRALHPVLQKVPLPVLPALTRRRCFGEKHYSTTPWKINGLNPKVMEVHGSDVFFFSIGWFFWFQPLSFRFGGPVVWDSISRGTRVPYHLHLRGSEETKSPTQTAGFNHVLI